MKVATTIESVRSLVGAAREQDRRIGLVPTMGALHVGHVSLIDAAVKNGDFVVVSHLCQSHAVWSGGGF